VTIPVAGRITERFGDRPPFTIGVEEELFLVDPITGSQVDAAPAVLERVTAHMGNVVSELHACQIELVTDV
jgi:carboxylate-amine ligase